MSVGFDQQRPVDSAMTTATGSCSSLFSLHSSPSYSSLLAPSKAHHVALAASGASMITKFLLYPLDTLKSRVQNYTTPTMAVGSGGGVYRSSRNFEGISPRQPPKGFARLVKWGLFCGRAPSLWQGVHARYAGRWGLPDLYAGFLVKITLYQPYQMCYQNGYNAAAGLLCVSDYRPPSWGGPWEAAEDGKVPPPGKKRLSADRKGQPFSFLWRVAVSAVAAELASFVLRIPIETIKLRVQTNAAANARGAIRQLFRHGFKSCGGLFLPQTVVHDIPYSIIQWVVYESLRGWALTSSGATPPPTITSTGDGNNNHKHSFSLNPNPPTTTTPTLIPSRSEGYFGQFLRVAFTGGLSGLTAATLTIPLDNIRTRVTVATARDPSLSVRDVIGNVYRRDGPKALFRGGATRVLCVSLNMAVYFPAFELGKWLLAE